VNMTTIPRRRFLSLAGATLALPAVSRVAYAQAYPNRPIRLIVGFVAGGGQSIVAHMIGQSLSERLGQPVVIDNRPGAGGNIGAESVIRSPPDGYTLLLCGSPNSINATLYTKLTFDFAQDVTPVADIMHVPLIMEVNPDLPAKNVAEFIAYAKANPGKINYGSAGIGSPQHAAGELFKMMTGVALQHVPYRGTAPALTDLLAGQVQVMFDPTTSSIGHVQSGKVRALAVTSMQRAAVLPDTPAVADTVPGYEASSWYGICGPKGLSADIVARLNKEVNASLGEERIKARIVELGGYATPGTSSDFAKSLADEIDKWGKVIKFSGARVD
jgi:tripartite-type tricarboxylate transporter receptor subunit TctC